MTKEVLKPFVPKEYVKGTFHNLETPGMEVTFGYDSLSFTFLDGGEYIIPKEVADHLNKNCRIPIRKFMRSSDDMENPSEARIVSYRPRYQFMVLENVGEKPKKK